MAATFSWVEVNATAGDTHVPTNLNLGSTNYTDLAPSTYPITAGTSSYEKWVTGLWSGTFTRIENLQFWKSAGALNAWEHLLSNVTTASYSATTTYATPTNAASAIATIAMPAADPAAANLGIGGSLTGSLTSAGSSDFLIIQASIESSATPGAVTTKTFTLQYDEV